MWLGSGWANRGAVSLAQRGSGRMSGGTRGKNHGESLALLLDKHSVIGTQRVHCFYCGSQRSDAQPRGATVFRDSCVDLNFLGLTTAKHAAILPLQEMRGSPRSSNRETLQANAENGSIGAHGLNDNSGVTPELNGHHERKHGGPR